MNSSGQAAVTLERKTNENIQVYVRVRPTNAREKRIKSLEMVEVHPQKEITVKHALTGKMKKKFTFDKVFGQDSRQSDVYSSVVAPLIGEVLAGYNCTVFAYGQTGTGKTYTMVGEEEPVIRSSWDDDSMIGIIPRALNHLFDELRLMELEYSIKISYLELYNEELCDLLSSTDDFTKIRIFDDPNKKGSLIIQGLEEIPVHNINDVYKLLAIGQEKRKTAATLMNAQSSRSHTVFSILVHIKEHGIDGEEMVKIGKLNLVDLAGSENTSKAGNEKGIRTREAVNINQSLLTLGRVITALVERAPHIPYRESKLTRLLQESLGGRTKTSIIATISPGHKDIEETLSTLEYAHRAKNIQNKPEINQRLTKRTILKEYTEEIDRLKRDLMAAKDKNGIFLADDTYNDMVIKLENQKKEINDKLILIKALKEDLTSKQKLFSEVSMNLIDKTEQLMEKEKILNLTKAELNDTQKNLSHAQRRCEEKTFLLDKHVKTEEVLTQQAKELLTVAEHASSDTYSLHDTITRRKEVDNKLKSSCDQFSIKLTNTLTDMDTNLNDLKTNHLYHTNLILSDLDKNSSLNREFKNEFGTQLKTLMKFNNNSINIMYNCIKDYTTLMNNCSDEYKSVIDEMLINIQESLNNIKSECNEQLDAIEETYTVQNRNVEEQFKVILNKQNENSNMIEEFCSNQTIYLQTLITETTNVFNENLNIINKTTSKCRIANDEQLATINCMEIEVEKLFKKMRSQIDKSNENTEVIMNASNTLNNSNDKLNENIVSHALTINKHNDTVKNNFANINTIIDDLNSENSENLATISDAVKTLNTHQNSTNENLKANVEDVKTKTDEYLCKLNENIVSVKNEALSKQQQTQTEIDVEFKQFSNTIENKIHSISKRNTQTIALQNLLQDTIKKYELNCRSTIDLSKNHLEKFVAEEMVVYVPTGETPMKKQFNISNSLVSTSPHENLIKRFRLDRKKGNNSLNSVTEEEESIVSIDENILNVAALGNLEDIQDNNNIGTPLLLDIKKSSKHVSSDEDIE